MLVKQAATEILAGRHARARKQFVAKNKNLRDYQKFVQGARPLVEDFERRGFETREKVLTALIEAKYPGGKAFSYEKDYLGTQS